MFRVKICGVTTPADAQAAWAAGADAIGLNFYPRSSRYVTSGQAREISSSIPASIQRVGVFVNMPAEDILRIADQVGLTAVQLHGDEPPEFLAALPKLPIVRARRIDADGLAGVVADLAACRAADRTPDAVLVDAAAQPGEYGGTGETLVWDRLADHRELLGGVPLILAGGLAPQNVAEAIRIAQPAGVDVASGVESAPGRKDAASVLQFAQNALAAFSGRY